MLLPSWLRFLDPASGRTPAQRHRSARRSPCRLRVEALEDRTLPSTFTVLNLADSGDGSLRAAVLAANASPGADLIEFARGLRGAIVLTSGELSVTDGLTISGPGASKLTISGNNASRVFDIAQAQVALSGLTIADGLATGTTALGGGILNTGGNLTISQTTFSNNQARGDDNALAGGGAIANVFDATLTITESTFNANSSTSSSRADGGAILSDVGSALVIQASTFTSNHAIAPGELFGGDGGAIANVGTSTATISQSTFTNNEARGLDAGPGKTGGSGFCGAVYNGVSLLVGGNGSLGAILTVSQSTFSGNQALGGKGGSPIGNRSAGTGGFASGGAIGNDPGATATITDTVFSGNRAVGGAGGDRLSSAPGGEGGETTSGAIFTLRSHLRVERSTFIENQAIGGAGGSSLAVGGNGKVGKAGAIFVYGESGFGIPRGFPTIVDLVEVTMLRNQATGGAGGAAGQGGGGGRSRGGAIDIAYGTLNLSRSTLDGNLVTGGAGGSGATTGHGGNAFGGGINNGFVIGSNGAPVNFLTMSDSLLKNNQASGGTGGVGGDAFGGGIANGHQAAATIINSTIRDNQAIGGAGIVAGGDGLGGGIWNQDHSTLTLLGSTVTENGATGGAGATAGQGVGGGIYNTSGGTVCVDAFTAIFANLASTSDDDVFGDLCLL